MTALDNLHVAAAFLGGWAAVHLSIDGGMLPPAPLEIETVAGDHGYMVPTSYSPIGRQVQADARDPASVVARARDLTLDVLRARLDRVVELGTTAGFAGYVREDVLGSTIPR
jgi:hypothetical protein